MGEVHNAFDDRHQRYVALKLLSAEVSADPGLRDRFQREAQIVALLRHPHVIPVHGYGEIDGRLYLDMRLVEGSDLATVLEGGPLAPARAVDVVSQVAGALDAAHDEGLVHRDVKPSNVLMARGSGTADFAYLSDFGIARSIDAPAITREELPSGTLAYMAPERFRGGPPAAAGDIYALACLLYECLTGRRPFEGNELPDLLYAHLDHAPPKPSVANPSVPVAFDAVIERGLAKDPADRYRTASALADAARAALNGDVVGRSAGPRPGARPRRMTRRFLVPTVVSTLAIAIVVGAMARRPEPGQRALGENSVGMVSASSGHVTRSIAVDSGPAAVASGFGAVWTANTDADTVSRVDATTGAVTRIVVQSAPSAIAVGPDSVWVTNGGAGTVTRIDPSTDRTQTIQVGTAPGGIVVDGAVWVANTGDATVSRIDPAHNKVVSTIPVGTSPAAIGGGHDIWVANSSSNTVTRIDAATNAVVQTIAVGNDPEAIRVVGGWVWVANNLDGTVTRIPTDGTSKVTTVPLGAGSQPTGFAESTGTLWVVSPSTESLDEIDVRGPAPRLARTLPLGVVPSAVTAVDGGRSVWVTGTINPAHHQGGTLRLRAADAGSSDPSYVSIGSAPGLLNSTYDGLVGLRHASGSKGLEIVPDLATALPAPTEGGRTYTFHVRTGIRWSDGRPLTVFDIRRGFERAVASGLLNLRGEVVGATGCNATSCTIDGIQVDSAASTVTIRLLRPNAEFLQHIVFCSAVPASTPLAEQKDVPVPATGPYQVSEYVANKSLTLTRNPYFQQWSAAAQPAGYPDRIEFLSTPDGAPPTPEESKKELGQLGTGAADWVDARFAGTATELRATLGERLHVSPDGATRGVMLNTRIAPFNDVRVRRALSFAVDRAAAAAAWPSTSVPTCQVLPPDFPGYRPYCPYTLHPTPSGTWDAPDFATATKLVAASGTTGMDVTVWSLPNPAPGVQAVVAALSDLGYRAHLKVGSPGGDYFGYTADSRNKVQAAFYGWYSDDPSPHGFIPPLFACSAYKPASQSNTNVAAFCEPRTEELIGQAEQLAATSPEAANDSWALADRHITDAAPFISLVTTTYVDAVSARVHNYVRNPIAGVLFDQMWLT